MTDRQRARAARDRLIVAALADGLSVRAVARLFGLTPARVSQIKKSLESLARGNSRDASTSTVASARRPGTERARPPRS